MIICSHSASEYPHRGAGADPHLYTLKGDTLTHNRESLIGQIVASTALAVWSCGLLILVTIAKWNEESKPSLEVNLDKVAMMGYLNLILIVIAVLSVAWLWRTLGCLDSVKKSAHARASIASVDTLERRRAQTPKEPVVKLVRVGRLPPRRSTRV